MLECALVVGAYMLWIVMGYNCCDAMITSGILS